MSLRHLAAEVGIQVGSLYNHISTKQDLLFGLLHTHMESLLQHLEDALPPGMDPEAELRTFVVFHAFFAVCWVLLGKRQRLHRFEFFFIWT